MSSPQAEPVNSLRKYHVIVEAEGADGLNIAPGSEVCFVLKRHGKVSISPCAEVWDDGIVYWDAKLSQVCTLVPESDGSWRHKPCEIQVQTISLDENGAPTALGEVLAYAQMDLAAFCDHDSAEEPTEPQKVKLELSPKGIATIYVSSVWLQHWVHEHDDVSSEASVLSLTPAPSTASLGPEESSMTLGGYLYGETSTAASSPEALVRAQQHYVRENQQERNSPNLAGEEEEVSFTPQQKPEMPAEPEEANEENKNQEEEQSPKTVHERTGSGSYFTPEAREPSLASSGLGRSSSGVSSGSTGEAGSISALQRRCRRLARERDEARAESFAEASVAVQRGIEIENLKRAKDMLLQRLENTERQLMMAMRLDPESPSASSGTSRAAGGANKSIAAAKDGDGSPTSAPPPYGDPDAVLNALVDAKLALAQKEFENMEIQGQLRAKEAHIQALTDHLNAVRLAAEERAVDHATPATSRSLRSVWYTPSITPPWSGSRNPTPKHDSKPGSTRGSPLGEQATSLFASFFSSHRPPPTPVAASPVGSPLASAALAAAGEHPSEMKTPAPPVVHIIAHASSGDKMIK